MHVSEQRLSAAARSGVPDEEFVALRIIDSPRDFTRWEAYHCGLMRRVLVTRDLNEQRSELLSASLGLIHRKAIFEYARRRALKGQERVRFFAHFYANSDYATSVVTEHGHYLRSAASYLCSSHVGRQVMVDEIFDEPLDQYETLYSEYFRAYCDAMLGLKGSNGPLAALVMPLKRQVCDWREALFALANSRSGTWRTPAELRARSKPGAK